METEQKELHVLSTCRHMPMHSQPRLWLRSGLRLLGSPSGDLLVVVLACVLVLVLDLVLILFIISVTPDGNLLLAAIWVFKFLKALCDSCWSPFWCPFWFLRVSNKPQRSTRDICPTDALCGGQMWRSISHPFFVHF